MATVRISQLTAITTPTDDDVLIINDADTNTRKITYANLTQGLLNTSVTPQIKAGPLTVSGTLTAAGNLVVDTNTFFVDSVNNRVGVKTISPNTELDVNGNIHVRNAFSLQLGDANDSNYVGLRAPSVVGADYNLTMPAAVPPSTNLLVVGPTGNMEYSEGVTYNSSADALEAGDIRLTDQGSVRFYEDITNGSEYVQFNAPSTLSTTNSYTLPDAFPLSSGFVLASTTGGVLSWVSNSAAAAGLPGQIQFNGGAGLSADADLLWDSGTNTIQTVNVALSGEIIQDSVARQTVYTDATVATAATFSVNLGLETGYSSFKLLVTARDNVTGDIESYEHLIVQDGSGGISEISGSNVQAPVPGVFLTTPATAISGGDVVCGITNSAIAANPITVTVSVTSIALL